MQTVDVAIIGGGAAGLSAAIEAKKTGAENVLVLERGEELGGILQQCIHTGFGLHYFKENLSGPEYISRFIKTVHELGIDYKLNTMVLQISSNTKLLAMNSIDGPLHLQAKAIVLAMGCREKPRGALAIPGTRPAGIFTAGTAQRLMDVEGYLVGKKLVMLGSGDIGLIMARRFVMEGAKIEAVVELMPYPGGLHRNVVQCLEDFQIPLLLQHTITNIQGRDRLKSVTIAKVDKCLTPIPGTEKNIECDTLILSVGLIPENELSRGLGILIDTKTGGPFVDEHMETSERGLFACGNVVHVHDLVDYVTWSGEVAGKNAARVALGTFPRYRERISLRAGRNVQYVVPQFISGKKPVNLSIRVKRPARRVEINIGNELAFHKPVVRPSEMVVLTLKESQIMEKTDLVVSVRKRR